MRVLVVVVIKGGGGRQLFNPPRPPRHRHTAITVNRVCLHLIINHIIGGECPAAATAESCRRMSISVNRMAEERNFQSEEVEKNKMEMGCYLAAILQRHISCPADLSIPDCSSRSEHFFRQFPRMLDCVSS